jgi:hypothetical protein
MDAPAQCAADAEAAELPVGTDDRFAGYGVMGLPFASGHVLAMRRFTASSVGPAYTSVWHRQPDGRWAFWSDQADEHSCARYFSAALAETRRVAIELSWPEDATLRVGVPEVGLEWTARLSTTAVTRALNAVGGLMPDRAWRSPIVLRAMGPVAGRALGAGRVSMVGTAPNGQAFVANPRRLWVIDESNARLGDEALGPVGALEVPASLGDFVIPQRGVFAIGRAFFHR